tara:strand:- start:864 stop:1589 length:726 start_codon:yes stop_codon:yes gene_type:complete
MKKKILIFIISYNASHRLIRVFKRINFKKFKNYNVKILISDDRSNDDTIKYIKKIFSKNKRKVYYKINKKNLHYGGNIKSCLNYAQKRNFDYAVMIHGDDQYDPKYIPLMLKKIIKFKSISICGSKMRYKKKALNAKMPFYKFLGNIVLTKFFNFIYNTNFSDCHTGLWLYDLKKIKKTINLNKITNDYNFDNQLRIEIVKKNHHIYEVPIVAKYSDEKSSIHVFYAIKFFIEVVYKKIFS